MARKASGRLQPADSPEAHRRLQATLAAFLPASRLTIALQQPMDTARSLMTSAALKATAGLSLDNTAKALGRTTRSVRMLLERFGPDVVYSQLDDGQNVVNRAVAALAEGPLTQAQLATRLPQYYAFDSAKVALRALLNEGRVRAALTQRGRAEQFELVPVADRKRRPDRGTREIDAVRAHMTAALAHLGQAAGPSNPTASLATDHSSARPEDFRRALAEISTFIEARLEAMEAGADADSPTFTIHWGGAETGPRQP